METNVIEVGPLPDLIPHPLDADEMSAGVAGEDERVARDPGQVDQQLKGRGADGHPLGASIAVHQMQAAMVEVDVP